MAGLVVLPAGVRPVAWLCLGPVTHLEAVPDLERVGWTRRLPLDAVVHRNGWGRAIDGPDTRGSPGDGSARVQPADKEG